MLAPRRTQINRGLLGMADPAAFSEQSLRRMQGVNPALVGLMKEVERRALDQGIKVEVSEGLRDPARQAELVEQGKSQTLNSKHLKGNALDIHVRNPDGSANWDFDAYRPVAEIAKQVAAEKGVPNLVWGGDWKSLRDGVHFELAGSNYAAPQGTRKSNMMRGGAGQTSLLGQSGGDTLEPERGRGLLGGFFGPEGRDARSRMAIALEGMTLNPNTALIGSLQEGIKGRRDDKRTNATVQWLRSRGRDDLAAAIDGGLPAADALRIAMQPAGSVEGVSVGGNLVNPITGEIIYQGAQEQGEVRQVGDRLVRVSPDGTVAELYAAPQATVTQSTGLELGLTGDDAGKLFNVDPSGKITAIGGGGTTVTNVIGGEGTTGVLSKKLAEAEGSLFATYAQQGPIASSALQDLSLLQEILPMAPQGPIVGRVAEYFPGFSSAGAAASAVIKRVAPTLRVEGSGSTSDIEYNGMLQSLPSLQNYPEANAAIVAMMQAKAAINLERAELVRDFSNSKQKDEDAANLRSRLSQLDRRSIMTPNLRAIMSGLSAAPQGGAGGAGASGSAAAPAQTATPPMPADFAAKYGAEAARNNVSIEDLWEAWPNK